MSYRRNLNNPRKVYSFRLTEDEIKVIEGVPDEKAVSWHVMHRKAYSSEKLSYIIRFYGDEIRKNERR